MLTFRRLWPLLVLAGLWWSPTVIVRGRLAASVPVMYVPLDGEALADGACVPMIAAMVHHPNWSIGVAERAYSCMGHEDLGTHEIHADGRVRYVDRGITRWLALTSDELAQVRNLGTRSCEAEEPHFGRVLQVSAGVPSYTQGVRVNTATALGDTLDRILQAAEQRYFDARHAELADARRVVKVARRERITLDGTRLRVWRGRRVVDHAALTAEEQVRIIEAIDQGIEPDDRRAPYALQQALWALRT